MPTVVDRREVERLVEEGGQLVEVLPQEEYDEEHLPGAIQLPPKSLTRAAWRLEALGYHPVYDYVGGKADWLAAGLPTQGNGSRPPRVAEAMTMEIPTCGPGESVSDVAARLGATNSPTWVVVNDHGVVQGRFRRDRIDPADGRTVEEAMEHGPAPGAALGAVPWALVKRDTRGLVKMVAERGSGRIAGCTWWPREPVTSSPGRSTP